jgi:two-component system NtrC family sensor kinase
MMLFVTLVVVWTVRYAVHRPVKALAKTLSAVGSGDYTARYDTDTISEFAFLGEYTNRMARDLERANAELVDWARTLERRVDEKTSELRSAQDRMLQIERMASLGKLAAVVAHEINNPLASVLTYSRLLLRRFTRNGHLNAKADDSEKILDAIASEAARCGEIVSSLLLFAPRSEPRWDETDMCQVVQRCLFLLKHKMDVAGVRSEVQSVGTNEPIMGDPGQLQQAILALCINAVEAMLGGQLLFKRTLKGSGLRYASPIRGRHSVIFTSRI